MRRTKALPVMSPRSRTGPQARRGLELASTPPTTMCTTEHDATGRVCLLQDVLGLMGGEGMALLRGPLGRGALCAATTSGRLAMVDVRAKPRVGVTSRAPVLGVR